MLMRAYRYPPFSHSRSAKRPNIQAIDWFRNKTRLQYNAYCLIAMEMHRLPFNQCNGMSEILKLNMRNHQPTGFVAFGTYFQTLYENVTAFTLIIGTP